MALAQDHPLRRRIARSARLGTLSHAAILCGGAERSELALYYAAALQCEEADKPCLRCIHCRKVLSGIHPDVISVSDQDHKTLPVERLRQLRQDVFIRPNEGQRKVYLFEDSRQLTPQDQDVLLKTVEEGPAYAAFLFCTDNSAVLLPTIRSRCVELQLSLPEQEAAIGTPAQTLGQYLLSDNADGAIALLLGMEKDKYKSDALISFLQESNAFLSRALLEKALPFPQRRRIMALVRAIGQAEKECDYHIGAGHLLGALAAEVDQLFR